MSNAVALNENFEIVSCNEIIDIENRAGFKKLKLNPSQKIQVGGLLQQIPALTAAKTLSEAYVVRFPEGIPNALTPLKQGGYGSMVKMENGQYAGSASLYPIESQAAVLGAFNAMSIVSGQYFLAQINNELKTMNQNIDKILEFLYGDKRAELISEVAFVKSAYQNYGSIMEHELQRAATLVSLQEAKKVAMKDIEFYMSDLDSEVGAKGHTDVGAWVNKVFQIKDCLELSIQLYAMSSLLEVFYSQNYDADYISSVERDASVYVGKCEKRMLSSFSKLSTLVHNLKDGPLKKIDKPALEKRADQVVDSFGKGAESEILRSIRFALHAPEKETEYYLNRSGDLYLKTA